MRLTRRALYKNYSRRIYGGVSGWAVLDGKNLGGVTDLYGRAGYIIREYQFCFVLPSLLHFYSTFVTFRSCIESS